MQQKSRKSELSQDIVDEFYQSILMLNYDKLISLIQKYEINLNQVCHNLHDYPLLYASEVGDRKMVKILIEHGADVNIKSDTTSMQALYLACIYGNMKIADLLIENNAVIDSPLQRFQVMRRFIISEMIDYMKLMMRKKIFPDFNEELHENFGIKLLFIAIKNNSLQMVQILVKDLNVDINRSFLNHTPMLYALLIGNREILNYLYKNGAKFDDKFILELEIRSLRFEPNLEEPIQSALQDAPRREVSFHHARHSMLSRVQNLHNINTRLYR